MKMWRIMLVVAAVAALALAAGAYAGTLKPITKVNKAIGGSYDPMGKVPSLVYPKVPIHITSDSPGDSLDFTWYDFQSNGSMSRQIALDHVGSRGLHLVYMKAPNSSFTPRNSAYQFNDRAGSGWSGELDMNTARSGYVTLGVLPDGRGVGAFHQVGGAGIRSVVAVDAARGAGAFTVHNVDTSSIPPAVAATPVWPHVGVSGTYVHVAAHQNSISRIMSASSANEGSTFTHWARVEPSVSDTSVENCISQDVIPGPSGKVAIAFTRWTGHGAGTGVDKQRNMDIWYVESTDNGATWGTPVNVTSYPAADSVRAYNDVSGVYDAAGSLHLVWTGALCLTDNAYYNAAAIWHWKQGGSISRVSGAGNVTGTWWWAYDGKTATWNQTVTRPSLSMDSTGNLFCVWSGQFDQPADSAANGFENHDLYGSGSVNSGLTWTTPFNITNSHTPGAVDGACADDQFPSIASFTQDSVRIFWEVDRSAGDFLNGEGAGWGNPFHYYAVVKSLFVGVEGQPPMVKAPSQFELGMARPNPVGKHTEIQYALPVPRNVNLSVYNAAGQLVKVLDSGAKAPGYHSATWDASSVPAGVYFYRLNAGEFRQTRTMVVVR